MQKKDSVLVVTKNHKLWAAALGIKDYGWTPVLASSFDDFKKWSQQGSRLVIFDNALNGFDDFDEKNIFYLFLDMKVLVVSSTYNDFEGQGLLSKGASGYTHLNHTSEHLDHILSSLQAGAIWLGRSLLQKLLRDIDMRLPGEIPEAEWSLKLSTREKEVALLTASGKSNADIAKKLNITDRTVRAHLSTIFDKLDVADRLQLTLKVHGIKN